MINLASGNSVQLQDVIEKILALSKHTNVELSYDKSKPSMIPVRRIDVSRAEQRLGWVAKVDLDEGLTKTICWYEATTQGGLEIK